MSKLSATLLSAVIATGAGNPVQVDRFRYFTFFIEATGITTGGTMKIQTLTPAGNWVDVDSRAISATGSTIVTLEGAYDVVRANLSARTDGTYTVSMIAAC